MQIDKTTLPSMGDFDRFVKVLTHYAQEVAKLGELFPHFSIPRLHDAHGSWRNDLERVEDREDNLDAGLDHFKQCGHLAFWIRRHSPIVEYADLTSNYQDGGEHQFTRNETERRELLVSYGNEFIAFDFGLQFCLYYERRKAAPTERAKNFTITMEYIESVCHFLKFKQVSPHALYLIYKSLFV